MNVFPLMGAVLAVGIDSYKTYLADISGGYVYQILNVNNGQTNLCSH